MINKDEIKNKLKNNIGTIKFKKKDNTIRTMKCTLSEELLPESNFSPEDYKSKKVSNPDSLAVWDLDKLAWRSFRLDSILEYSFDTI
jgi:hypothetical protein